MDEQPSYEELKQRIQGLELDKKKNENFLRQIIDLIPSCITIKNRAGKFILANKKTASFYGPDVNQMIGRFEYEYAGLHSSDHAEINNFLEEDQQVIDSGETKIIPNGKFTLPNGEVHTFHLSKIPISTFGCEDCVLVVATDITENIQTKEALKRKSEERRMLLDTIDTQIWYLTDAETYGAVNHSHADFLGYSPEDIAYKRLEDVFSKDVTAVCRKNNRVVFDRRQSVHTEEWIPNAQGENRLIKITKTPKINEDNTVEFVVCSGIDITENKKVQQELKTNKNRLQKIVENMPVMMDALDENFNIVTWNRECERITGYSAEEISNHPDMLELLYPDAEYRKKMIIELENSKFNFRNKEYKLTCKNGTKKTINWSNISDEFPIPGWYTWAIGVDITRQVQAEKDLKKSEETLRGIFDVMQSGVILVNKSGEIIFSNNRMAEIFGCDNSEVVGTSYLEHTHDTESSEAGGKMCQLIRGEISLVSLERFYKRKDGSTFWGHLSGRRLLYPDGTFWALVAVINDITQRKHSENKLRKSEKKYRTYIDNSPLGVFIMNEYGSYIDVNSTACSILGYSRKELLLLSISELDKTFPDECTSSLFSKLKETGYLNSEMKLKKKDGSLLEIDLQAVSLGSNRYMAYCTDLTEKKQLEERLLQSQKMESIGTLAGGIAHEFNNILSIIIGNNELIKEEVPEWSLVRENIDEIRIAGIRGRDVIRQLLTFSRQDNTAKKVIHLGTIVSESLQLIRSYTPIYINIHKTLSHDIFPILGNHTQVNQLLINLCNNAADAMEDKSGTIAVDLSNEIVDASLIQGVHSLKSGPHIKLVVSDNGSGMDKETLDKIFEPYYTTKEIGKGTGIGLAIVHGIVKRHNGSILAESHPGKGTTFTILIPAYKGMEEQKKDEAFVIPTGNECILYVDDEPGIAKLGMRHLESLGYAAEATTDPLIALEIFKKNPDKFDLVITDMAMPNMTGDQLIIEILKLRPNMRTIICTGHSAKMSEKEAGKIGVCAFAMKPLDKIELARKVREVLDKDIKLR